MLRGVGAPGPPRFSSHLEPGSSGAVVIDSSDAPKQANVGGWKCVHLAHGAQRNVVRGPFAYSVNCAEAGDRTVDRSLWAKEVGIGRDCGGKGFQRPDAGKGHPEAD